MREKIHMRRERRLAPAKPVLACAAVVAALLVAPSLASACPSLAKERSFVGTVSMSFSGSASGSNASSGGTLTVSLDRTASDLRVEVKRVEVKTGPSSALGAVFGGSVTGGTISVNDQYADSWGTTGQETASGSPVPGSNAQLIQLPRFGGPNGKMPLGISCDYQVFVNWGIHATPSGSWPDPPDGGASANAHTPATPIPSSLDLSGSVTVPAYYNDQSGPNKGWYAFGNNGSFEQTFDELKSCGTVYGGCGPSGQPDGTATISWQLLPDELNCVVPKLTGDTVTKATGALQKAGCKLGEVTSKASFTMPKGRVISSNPPAGKKLAAGAKVDLVISGPPCTVPSLIGQPGSGAANLLAAANCTLGQVTNKYSFTGVGQGKIISSSPKAGSKLAYRAPVAITVSLGPAYCSVPKFLPGETLFKAKMLLSNPSNFCTVGKIAYQSSTTFATGTVIASNPKPGTQKLPAGTPVALTISSGP